MKIERFENIIPQRRFFFSYFSLPARQRKVHKFFDKIINFIDKLIKNIDKI